MYFFTTLAECGGVYSGVMGNISSPNYPSLYPNDAFCVYQIIAPNQYGNACIEFRALNLMPNDFVEIYEDLILNNTVGRWVRSIIV